MEYIITGTVSERQTPSLFRYLKNINLRTIHGRSMLCILIDKAVSLTIADKARYGAAIFSALAKGHDSNQARRLSVAITQEEQPDTIINLQRLGIDPGKRPDFFHLIEIAAGLLYLDSLGMASGQAQLPIPPPLPSPAVKEPEVTTPPTPKKPVIEDAHNIISSASIDRGQMGTIDQDDLIALMGSS